MCGPTSSYAAAGIALEFIVAHKPLSQQQSAFDKVETPSRGNFNGQKHSYFETDIKEADLRT
jgi:hypothetical protein